MNNFTYLNPVKVVFGKDTIEQLTDLIPNTENILMVYGGGSIKKNGVYDQVNSALKNHKVYEFSGVEPNPTYETCMNAVEYVKKHKINFILAVGGGSVLDAVKFIAAATKVINKDPWGILTGEVKIEAALPLGSVLTLPATGSEMNCNSVISKKATDEKLAFSNPLVYPVFSIVDPQTNYSLPLRQTINGIVDSYVHVMEQYMISNDNTPLQDRQAEAIIQTLIEIAPTVLSEPENYDARANLCWCATQALNGLISCGVVTDWSTHGIGHELTAFYGIDHAQSLSVVMPRLWNNQREIKKDKLIQYGRRIFGITSKNSNEVINEAIAKTEEFFRSCGVKTKLSEYNVDSAEAADKISRRFKERNLNIGEKGQITPEDVKDILSKC